MVQVPLRGVWGRSGRPLRAPLESWLGRPLDSMPIERLDARYLAAFGPATVRDIQTWCGLTKLAEVIDAMRAQLFIFTDEEGRELFDVPDAPRPDADTAAPVRYLYDYDNLWLSHTDRSRAVYDVDYAESGYGADSNRQPSSLLVDGFVAGTWTVTRENGLAVLRVAGFRRFSGGEQEAITSEGAALLTFLHPKAAHEVVC